ncbi:hypothetical protein EDC94DRAFT_584000 [Helicostylum pulchrum]|nr:hypothetical protein EDC94DRAFT_584000 [Helicostylum pulchrum]
MQHKISGRFKQHVKQLYFSENDEDMLFKSDSTAPDIVNDELDNNNNNNNIDEELKRRIFKKISEVALEPDILTYDKWETLVLEMTRKSINLWASLSREYLEYGYTVFLLYCDDLTVQKLKSIAIYYYYYNFIALGNMRLPRYMLILVTALITHKTITFLATKLLKQKLTSV